MPALGGSRFCWSHDPTRAAERAAARKLGGHRSKRARPNVTVAPPLTLDELRAALGRALASVELLDNSAQRGKTIASLVGVAVRLLEASELTQRIAALEELMRAGRP